MKPIHVIETSKLPEITPAKPSRTPAPAAIGYWVQRGRLFYWAHQRGPVWRVYRSNSARCVGRVVRSGGPLFLAIVAACQTHRVKYQRVS